LPGIDRFCESADEARNSFRVCRANIGGVEILEPVLVNKADFFYVECQIGI